ncbi:MAG: thermonuclease family protein [Bacteroidales bacterium]|nr:thermonuclease family protein [Bacteroidales bacterium]MBN2763643.1 thermonuclease family protein [Bacteroidales bacterium]
MSNAVTDCSSNNEIVNEYFQVIRIIDGDTFCIDDGSEKGCKVRLAGIDAPESRKSYKKNVQYYGPESTLQLAKLSLGKFVRLEYDIEKYDRYGRTLAYVFLKDGTFINAQLIKEGYAVVMTIPPNVKYADQFVRLQKNARKKAKGLWRKPVQ